MQARAQFLHLPSAFWAQVRWLSQELGYTDRKTGLLRISTAAEMLRALPKLDLAQATLLESYFSYRASVLNNQVMGNLMDQPEAEAMFQTLKNKFRPKCPLPMNKQKGEKQSFAYLTGIVNMLLEQSLGLGADFDPRGLATYTDKEELIWTMARRVDGAYPSIQNPSAIWEIKEYYYTTTFGSRVADGIYETLLDGFELQQLRTQTGHRVTHVLFIDSHFTWWIKGRSYLCRLIDMLHMGMVDEVIFGKEVVSRLPEIARAWVKNKQTP